MKRILLAEDLRINDHLSMGSYTEIVNQYLHSLGRKPCSGCTMTATEFKTTCYAKNHTENQLNITINYKAQTIEINEA